jgi:hypothetical protein
MKGEYGQFYKKPDGTRVADPGLMRFDADRDWQLSKSEIDVAMSAKVNKDELRMLAWMGKNLGALENLGDQKPGFSRADLDVFSQMKEHGTGGWSNTTRNVDWTAIGAASALTTAVVPKLLRVPMNPLRFATLAAVSIVSDVVIKAGWYTYIERPKIDTAIEELNSLPAVNKSK